MGETYNAKKRPGLPQVATALRQGQVYWKYSGPMFILLGEKIAKSCGNFKNFPQYFIGVGR